MDTLKAKNKENRGDFFFFFATVDTGRFDYLGVRGSGPVLTNPPLNGPVHGARCNQNFTGDGRFNLARELMSA